MTPRPVDTDDMALLAGPALAMCEPEIGHGQLTVTVERDAWLSAIEWGQGRHHLLLHTLVPAADPCLPTATGAVPLRDMAGEG